MQKYDEMCKTTCRICLNYENNQNMISLIDNNSQDGLSCHGKAVLTFATISLKKQDCLPTVMCKKCLYFLKQAIYFKLLCESSDKSLRKLVNLVGDNIEKVKEKIVEYTIFRVHFPKEHLIKSQKSEKFEINKDKDKHESDSTPIIQNKIVLPTANEETNIDNEDFRTHPNSDHNNDYGDELLNKMQKLIKSNISCDMIMPKALRKHLRLRKKQANQTKILNLNKRNKQRKTTKNFVCKICNKVLANQLTFKYHMQRHNGCRYICEHCAKGFPNKTEMKVHQISRHGTGPYLQCSHCPFKAPRKFELTEHERLHTGERPYACEKCGLTFRRRAIWNKHLILHTERKVQCPQCPRKFFKRSDMLAHANNIHNRIYVYLCNKCGATYTKTATVRRHMTERHGIPREMQGKIIRINKGVGYQEQ